MNALQLLGILLAAVSGFALMAEWLERRQKRARMHRLRLIARVYWPDPPPALPRPFTAQDARLYANPPRSSEMLPWR